MPELAGLTATQLNWVLQEVLNADKDALAAKAFDYYCDSISETGVRCTRAKSHPGVHVGSTGLAKSGGQIVGRWV